MPPSWVGNKITPFEKHCQKAYASINSRVSSLSIFIITLQTDSHYTSECDTLKKGEAHLVLDGNILNEIFRKDGANLSMYLH